MNFTHRRKIVATSLFVMVAIMQTYVGVSFAARTANAIAPAGFQGASASLTTRQNKPISVNGTDAITGATIVNGALIETPGQVSASVNIPGHAILDIEPDAKLIMEFDQNGNPKVTLREGCVTLHTKKGTTGEIDTIHGVAGKTDPAKDGVLRVCFPRGAAAPVVDGGSVATAGAATGGGGISTTTGVLIGAAAIGGVIAAVIIVPCRRGANPSPGEPRGVNDECR
jgi:hypothetical protein